jgi:hypothetical protein
LGDKQLVIFEMLEDMNMKQLENGKKTAGFRWHKSFQ